MANHDRHDEKHIPPEQIRFTRADIEAMQQELISEAPTEGEFLNRMIWDSDFADKVEFVNWLRPSDEQTKDATIQLEPAVLKIAAGPIDVRPEPPLEWPEGEFPPQEPRSEENDDTVFDEPDEGLEGLSSLDPPADVNVPPEIVRTLKRDVKIDLKRMIEEEFDRLEFAECRAEMRRKRLADFVSRFLSQIVSDQIGDALERANRKIRRGEDPKRVWAAFICSIVIATAHSLRQKFKSVVRRFAGK